MVLDPMVPEFKSQEQPVPGPAKKNILFGGIELKIVFGIQTKQVSNSQTFEVGVMELLHTGIEILERVYWATTCGLAPPRTS